MSNGMAFPGMRNGDGGELMQCSCGGTTVNQKATCRGTHLLYERCGGCGRCGQWVLTRKGNVLAIGERAQAQFETLKSHQSARSKPPADDGLADFAAELLEQLL